MGADVKFPDFGEKMNITPEYVLQRAAQAGLEQVIVVGLKPDGSVYTHYSEGCEIKRLGLLDIASRNIHAHTFDEVERDGDV